eukprot:8731421-Pyramimonas_sp.AAC.2
MPVFTPFSREVGVRERGPKAAEHPDREDEQTRANRQRRPYGRGHARGHFWQLREHEAATPPRVFLGS